MKRQYCAGILAAAGITLAVSGCQKGLKPIEGSPYAPGTRAAPLSDSVDGLAVGHRLMEAGEFELALKSYYRAAGRQGVNVDILSAIGSANLRLGRLGQAEQMLRRALEADPKFVPALNNLGVVLIETGRAGEAERVFRNAFSLDSGQSAAIRENLRLTLEILENPDYSAEDKTEFALMRRGTGDYLLLTTP